jgi:hypothetical protein
MTPPATAAHPARGSRRQATRPPRRVSGPAQAARRPVASARAGAAVAPPPLALRLAHAGARIGDAKVLDRLVRGRAWIAIVAVGLMGIVFMQVSMLRLNAGISNAVTSAETLHRQNASMRAEISELDAGERIMQTAGAAGMIEPPAGDVNYLDARRADGRSAARNIEPPNPVKLPASATTATTAPQAPAATAQAAAPQAGAAAATTQPQTQTPAAAQATTAQPAATQAQAAPPQQPAAGTPAAAPAAQPAAPQTTAGAATAPADAAPAAAAPAATPPAATGATAQAPAPATAQGGN